MQNNNPNGTRITVERISVTTIRTRDHSQKVYCDNCKAELASGDLASRPLLINGRAESVTKDHSSSVKKQ